MLKTTRSFARLPLHIYDNIPEDFITFKRECSIKTSISMTWRLIINIKECCLVNIEYPPSNTKFSLDTRMNCIDITKLCDVDMYKLYHAIESITNTRILMLIFVTITMRIKVFYIDKVNITVYTQTQFENLIYEDMPGYVNINLDIGG